MKTRILIAVLSMFSFVAFADHGPLVPDRMPAIARGEYAALYSLTGQPAPLNLPTNAIPQIPQASSFTNTTVELSVGVVASISGTSPENVIDVHYNVTQTFFVQGEIQNAASSSVLDVAGLGGGVRKAWDTAEIYGKLEGRRNWIPQGGAKPAWEGVLGAGVAWMPLSTSDNTFLRNSALWAETDGILSQSAKRPQIQSEGGYRYNF